MQEAKAASALNHPNIITVHDIDTSGDLAFLAMEYVDGKTLDQRIGHRGLRVEEALKPAHIMVTGKGLVKVLDFGRAKLTERDEASDDLSPTMSIKNAPRTEEGAILGTVAYMSPEQAEGKRVDARSDIFSFGAVLYEMATGRRPFAGETKMSILAAILHHEPKPPGEIAEGLPRELERVIARYLRKDPERRFQHMEDLKVALQELRGRVCVGQTRGPARSCAPPPPPLAADLENPGRSATQVTRGGGYECQESPDDKVLYYIKGRRGLLSVPVAGGEETIMIESAAMGGWVVSEKGIYFVDFDAVAGPNVSKPVKLYSFSTRQVTQVAGLEGQVDSGRPLLAISPEDRWLLWPLIDLADSDLVLVENFR